MQAAVTERVRTVRADEGQGAGLRVVPIVGPSHEEPKYELLREEILDKVIISEISDAGSVPTLQVRNDLDVRVFLMDGQELIGAKQNRILNTDVLVPAKSSLSIPVSCVEQGRWRAVSRAFSPGKAASYRTRSGKQARVHESLKVAAGFDANQGEVWNEVEQSLAASNADDSGTRALADAYRKRAKAMDNFRQTLRLPVEAVGVAVFHDGKLQGLDLFDRHATLKIFWSSLVDSYAIEFLDSPVDLHSPARTEEAAEVRSLMEHAAAGEWESFQSPGEGKDWRLEAKGFTGSALVWEENVVLHLQLFPRQSTNKGRPVRIGRIHPRTRRE